MRETYLVYKNWGGTYHDARKTGADSEMCWAAAGANILAWAGWSQIIPREPGLSAQAVFEQYKSESGVTNQEGNPHMLWEWWFDKYSINDLDSYYYHMNFGDRPDALFRIEECFKEKKSGVAVQAVRMATEVGETGNSHFITCWGFDFDETLEDDDSDKYTKIYITDSDDIPMNKQLQEYMVAKGNPDEGTNPNCWYIKALLGKDDYFIADVYALGLKIADETPGAPSAPTGLHITA